MSRTIGVAKTGDRRGGNLDFAARGRQGRGFGVAAEVAEDATVPDIDRQRQFAGFPELVEPRRVDAAFGQGVAGRLVNVCEPLPRRAALGECFTDAETLRQPGEDIVIVARFAVRADRAVHRDHQRVAGRRADILALQGDRRRQDDVGVARGRGPRRLMHDDRVRTGKGAAQTAEILMMVERVAAGPVDQLDIGIGQALAVVVERFAGVQQHVGDARDRDEIGDAVAADRQGRQRHRERRFAGIRGRAQRIGKAAARQPDLAEQRGQHDTHPDRLLAMLGALQRLRAGDQGAASGTAPRQIDDEQQHNRHFQDQHPAVGLVMIQQLIEIVQGF